MYVGAEILALIIKNVDSIKTAFPRLFGDFCTEAAAAPLWPTEKKKVAFSLTYALLLFLILIWSPQEPFGDFLLPRSELVYSSP